MCLFSIGFNYEFCVVCSKKGVELRTSELLDAVSEPLLEAVENDAGSWISSSSIGMVTLAVLKSGKGEWDGSSHWLLLNLLHRTGSLVLLHLKRFCLSTVSFWTWSIIVCLKIQK
jgi:hypothetical protein